MRKFVMFDKLLQAD